MMNIIEKLGGYKSSIADTKKFASNQWQQAKGEQPNVICECGSSMPLRFFYRCLFCKMYLCSDCAEIHFGQTVEEYKAKKELEYRRANNIFEVGDKVVIESYRNTYIYCGRPSQYSIGDLMVIHNLDGNVISDDDYNFIDYRDVRHATDLEIQAGCIL